MPKANPLKTNFTSGEISPLVRGRSDTTRYQNGADTLLNFIVRPQGGLWKRNGTKYIGSARNGDFAIRLQEFEFSNTQSYILEFGSTRKLRITNVFNSGGLIRLTVPFHGFITGNTAVVASVGGVTAANGSWTLTRIDKNTVQLDSSSFSGTYTPGTGNITPTIDTGYVRIWANDTLLLGGNAKNVVLAETSGGLIKITVSSHGYATGDTVSIDAIQGTTEANGTWVITVVDTNNFTLNGSTFVHTYVNGGIASVDPLVLLSPYAASELEQIKFAQSADILWMAQSAHPPQTIKRYGAISWSLSEFETKDGPYLSSDPGLQTAAVVGITNFGGIFQLETLGHTFIDGTVVDVSGITGATTANGRWTIDASGTSVRLVGSTFASGYSGGGLIQYKAPVRIYANQPAVSRIVSSAPFVRIAHNESGSGIPGNGFQASDIGRWIEFDFQGTWYLAQINSVISTTEAIVQIIEDTINSLPPDVYLTEKFQKVSPLLASQRYHPAYGPRESYGTATVLLETSQSGVFTANDVGKYIRRLTAENGQVNTTPTIVGNIGGAKVPNAGRADINWLKIHAGPTAGKPNQVTGQVPSQWTPATTVIGYNGVTSPLTWSFWKGKSIASVVTEGYIVTSEDIGRKVAVKIGGSWVHGVISSVSALPNTSFSFMHESVVERDPTQRIQLFGKGVSYEWKLGAWSSRTGYPSEVSFHEQRLIFGSTPTEPQTFWMSVSADFPNFAPFEPDGTVLDDSAVTYSFASRLVNKITWIQSGPSLLIGTIGGEWQVRAATSLSEPITPTNIDVKQQTTVGSIDNDTGQRVGPGFVFLQRSGRKMYDMTYSFDLDAWQSTDLTIVSEHILRDIGGGLETAYQQQPHSLIWVRGGNGQLASLTLDRPQEVAAWHRHSINGEIESLAVINDNSGSEDVLYVVRKTTVNNLQQRYIEKMTSDVYSGVLTDYAYLDSHIKGTTDGDGILFGLSHLEGLSFNALINGITLSGGVVSGGQFPFGAIHANKPVIVGLGYTTIVRTLPLEGGSEAGTAMGKYGRIARFSVQFFKSVQLAVYQDNTKIQAPELIEIHTVNPTAVSDFREYQLRSDYNMSAEIEMNDSSPWPLCILAVYPQQEKYE